MYSDYPLFVDGFDGGWNELLEEGVKMVS